MFAWSPLGRGVLTGKYRNGVPNDSRGGSAAFSQFVQPYFNERSRGIVDAVHTRRRGTERHADGAGAGVGPRPAGVTAPIVGVRTLAQAREAFASELIELPAEIRSALDDVSAIDLGYPDHGWNQRR